MTELMEDYSEVVVLEGQNPLEFVDLAVFVAHPPRPGPEAEWRRGEQLAGDVGRLRNDADVFRDILGWRGKRIPVTAAVANLADPRDRGMRKALARVRRAAKAAS